MEKIESNTSVDLLGFTNRTRNSLRRAHIDTYGDLLHAFDERELRCIRNLGKIQYEEILKLITTVSGDKVQIEVKNNPYICSNPDNIPEEIKNLSIDDMKLSSRLRNCLGRSGYNTVGKIMFMKKEDIYSIFGLGKKSISELYEVISRIEEEGAEYFVVPDPVIEPIDPDNLRTIDVGTVGNLIDNYGLKTKWVAQWYGVSGTWIREMLHQDKKRGNWLNRNLTEEDIDQIKYMVTKRLEIYNPLAGKTLYFLSNHNDDCAAVIVNDQEIKCFYLSMLPDDLQEMIRKVRLESITTEEFSIITEGEIISVLKKDFFRPKDPVRFNQLAQRRNMNSDKYCVFLTGMPLMSRMSSVTDDRIIKFLRHYCKGGKIVMPPGETCHWLRAFISRNGYSVKDIIKMYGMDKA